LRFIGILSSPKRPEMSIGPSLIVLYW
jgi:hypothetical protein